MELYNFSNLVNQPTCFKNPQTPTCIDLMLTNHPKCFQNTDVIETGLSDFHKMTVTVLKIFFEKAPPNIVHYRDYKNFSNDNFRSEILQGLYNINTTDIERFHQFLVTTLDKHAPKKTRYIRANQASFMNKALQKAIMTRSRLRNKFLKEPNSTNRIAFKKQRNLCVKLFRNEKSKYFNSLKTNDVVDNRKFWKKVKPFISDKHNTHSKITLIENENIIDNTTELCEMFANFFANIVPNLKIEEWKSKNNLNTTEVVDFTEKSIERYKNHPSIQAIQNNPKNKAKFILKPVTILEVFGAIKTLDSSKAVQETDLPTKIIKENVDIFAKFIYDNFNDSLMRSKFPSILTTAEVIPVFKKGSSTEKENYRPVSILSNISKIYERLIFEQIVNYFEQLLSKYQCGFRKGFSAQHCLIAMIEKWRISADNGGYYGAVLTDLSKAFDCLPHGLIIAKLHAYGFETTSLKYLNSYLTERKQRVKLENSFSDWKDIEYGVPQGSILGPLLFNIFISDIFICVDSIEIASYADDNTPYSYKEKLEDVLISLEDSTNELFKWFANNSLKSNAEKCHLLTNSNKPVSVKIGETSIYNSNNQNLLGITLDSNLTFESHINQLCKKAGQKLSALSRLSPYMSFPQKRLLMNALFKSQFSYCPLVWMCHSRGINN